MKEIQNIYVNIFGISVNQLPASCQTSGEVQVLRANCKRRVGQLYSISILNLDESGIYSANRKAVR